MSVTTNYGWTKPTVDGDADTWGTIINTTLDSIDSQVKAVADTVPTLPTGAVWDFLMAAAPSGWLALDGTTIGDASSSAAHASATYQALFSVLWALSATASPILTSGGAGSTRGASAAADWAAHKRLTLPDMSGRFRRSTGGSAGNLGETQASAYPSHTHSFAINQGGTFAGSGNVSYLQGTTVSASGTYSGTTASAGSGSDLRPDNIAFLTCIKI